jgi:gas vesicle protein
MLGIYPFGSLRFSHPSSQRSGELVTNTDAQNIRDRGFFIGVIAGGMIGAGLAMYFAPRAASELRTRMSGSARNLRDAATQQYQRTSARVSDAVGEISSAAKPGRKTRLGKKLPAAGSRATPGKIGQE